MTGKKKKHIETEEVDLDLVEEIDPQDYFANIKSKKQEASTDFLQNLYTNMEALLKKAHALGQTKVVKRLLYALEVLEKEKVLYDLGFRTFVYRDDVEYYMDKVTSKAVKIINLEEYPREIPDEVADKLMLLKERNLFDVYYIVFTDYTGQVEREVQAERKRRDPILFGAFSKRTRHVHVLHDRFYYIADWEDEYCDLTLDKMVSEMSNAGKEIKNPVCIPDADTQSIRDYVAALEEEQSKNDPFFRLKANRKKTFVQKLKFWEK